MTLIYSVLFIIVGIILLVIGSDKMVDGASSLAKRIGISEIIIGLTIVAFGTSAPELVVNLSSVYTGSTDIAVGNIIGSNIVNIFIILGLSALFTPIIVGKTLIYKDIPFAILSSVTVFVLGVDTYFKNINANDFVGLDRSDGIILLLFFIIFLYYIFSEAFSNRKNNIKDVLGDVKQVEVLSKYKSIFFIVIGLTFLIIGGKLVVDGAIDVARFFGISEMLIGLTIIAIGTSLPELFTSVTAARKGNSDIAISNVVGSSIFNVFFILGVTASISNLPINISNIFDMFVNILASVLIFVFLYIGVKNRIDRWQGFIFVLFYIFYVLYIINRG